MDAGADPNRLAPTNWRQRPLHRTLEFRITAPKHSGHIDVVRTLLEYGADPHLRATVLDMTPWELACFCGLQPAADILQRYQSQASPHPTGMTDLWRAAASRLPEEAKTQLIKTQVDTPWRKATPLIMAVGHAGHFRVADMLLEAGANPNDGPSILDASCSWHFEHLIPAIDFLVARGWDVNRADDRGWTALHKAAFLGYTNVVRSLLGRKADPALRDGCGATARDVADSFRKHGVARLLTN